ncbi:MAG: hypothetical protein IKQ92_05820 [Clostridia bacterium]|nr:hypothetical protein [Clostridia bacterium]
MKTKLTLFALILALLLSLSGCAGADNDGRNTNEGSGPNSKPFAFPEKISGLVAVQKTQVRSDTLSETIDVICIDPDSGESRTVRSFTTVLYSLLRGTISSFEDEGGIVDRHIFNEDYTLLAAHYADGKAWYAGWIDQYGNFTNVSEMCLGSIGSSSEFTEFEATGFDDFGYYYFCSKGSSGRKDYRVPVDNISPKTLENLDSILEDSPFSSTLTTIDCLLEFGAADVYAGYGNTTDWIDSEHCLCHLKESDDYIVVKAEGIPPEKADSDIYRYGPPPKKREHLIPDEYIDAYLPHWGGVLSPDGTTVAFLSRPESETKTSLYTVPLAGGEPVRVDTDVVLADVPYTWRDEPGPAVTAFLIEWK